MAAAGQISTDRDGLRLSAYPGDNMVLLAMSLADNAVSDTDRNLAGFAIWRKVQGKAEEPLLNRLSFDDPVNQNTTPAQRKWTPTPDAPIQKFRWVDVPADGFDKPISYRVMAKYFSGTGKALKDGPQATVEVQPPQLAHAKFRIAFTRGYASSQAYTEKFNNADIRPPGPKQPEFDTTPFTKNGQYQWLGADAYKYLFDFLAECRSDATARIDVFAYDLDEPDVIKAICEFGKQGRLRAVLDNAPLHTKKGAVEIEAAKLIRQAAGDGNVKQGKFARFQHNKVFIKRDHNGVAQKVLFGSMNFSLRGIFVQANNVMVVDDATTAGYFATAFDNAFKNDVKKGPFAADHIAAGFNPISPTNTANLPMSKVALSPHSSSAISLGPASDAIHQAQSSVLYAVMEPAGSGPVLNALVQIARNPIIFSYGTVESAKGLQVQSGDGEMSDVTSFSFLKDKVPWPFSKEWSGGVGMHIHHKFVVIDFNTEHPVLFTGSSNLAAGGEEANGDSLIMINDPMIASTYAIEAVRLFDHYAFRRNMAKATTVQPMTLWYPGKPGAPVAWWKASYDSKNIKFRDRYLFADLPLPAGTVTVKHVNWDEGGTLKGKASTGKSPATKASAKKAPAKKAGAKKAAAKKKTATKKAGAKKKKAPARKRAAKKVGKKAAKKATRKPAKKQARKAAKKKAKKGRR